MGRVDGSSGVTLAMSLFSGRVDVPLFIWMGGGASSRAIGTFVGVVGSGTVMLNVRLLASPPAALTVTVTLPVPLAPWAYKKLSVWLVMIGRISSGASVEAE